MNSSGSGEKQTAVTCEYGNEVSGFIKLWVLAISATISFPRRPLSYRFSVLGSLTNINETMEANPRSENTNTDVRSDYTRFVLWIV